VTEGVLGTTVRARESRMAETNNTAGTRRIEEGAFLPQSERFESEPWTSFYMAGEIIRELRKTQEFKRASVPATKSDTGKAA